MIQPFAKEVVEDGEYSYIFLNAKFSHCVCKKPQKGNFLTSPLHTQDYRKYKPTENELEQAQTIISTFARDSFHARLDVIHRNGKLTVMELELIEPFLFPEQSSGNFADNYAKALIERMK